MTIHSPCLSPGVRGCSVEIKRLEPHCDYKLRVIVENKHGASEPSPHTVAHRSEQQPSHQLPSTVLVVVQMSAWTMCGQKLVTNWLIFVFFYFVCESWIKPLKYVTNRPPCGVLDQDFFHLNLNSYASRLHTRIGLVPACPPENPCLPDGDTFRSDSSPLFPRGFDMDKHTGGKGHPPT